MAKREKWIDYLRLFCFYWVAFYHCTASLTSAFFAEFHSLILYFNLPLFFFISGYLFNPEKNRDFKQFLKKRFKALMIPYFGFSVVIYIFYVYMMNVPEMPGIPLALKIYVIYIKPLMNVLIGLPFTLARPLWFLPCLFLIEIIFYWVERKIKSPRNIAAILVVFAILGYAFTLLGIKQLPYAFNAVITMCVLYGAAYLLKDRIQRFVMDTSAWRLVFLLLLMIPYALLARYNGVIEILNQKYNHYWFFFMAFALGSVICLGLSAYLKDIPWLDYLAQNTIVLLALHRPLSVVLTSIFSALGIPQPDILFIPDTSPYLRQFWLVLPIDDISSIPHQKLSLLWYMAFTALQFVCLIPFIYIINKYLPFLLGKSYNRTKLDRGEK